MLNGYQRKMYFVKNTRSRFFSEAYFVLRDGADLFSPTENDLAAEADRIIREKFPRGKKSLRMGRILGTVLFFIGVAVGIGVGIAV